jgi:hypothetical protein
MLNEYKGKVKDYVSPWTEMKPTPTPSPEEEKERKKKILDPEKADKYIEGFKKG